MKDKADEAVTSQLAEVHSVAHINITLSFTQSDSLHILHGQRQTDCTNGFDVSAPSYIPVKPCVPDLMSE